MHRLALIALIASTAWGLPGDDFCGSDDDAAAKYPIAKMSPEVQKARQECKGRHYPDFTSMDGTQFHEVTGAVADDIGFRFNHSAGAKSLRYDDLPPELQREFLGVSYPNMSPEVMRRRGVHLAGRQLETSQAQLDGLRGKLIALQTAKEHRLKALEQSHADSQAKRQEEVAATRERISRLEEEHQQRKAELASFDQPEVVVARRAEMKRREADMAAKAAAVGRTPTEITVEKFDARQKEAIKNSIRLAAQKIYSAKESLASSQNEARLADRGMANTLKQVAEGESRLAKDIALSEKRVESDRKKLSTLDEDSKKKGDDPGAFDRYCKDNGFPR